MADAFAKVQFMEPPTYGGVGPVPVGAVKAGQGIEILPDGTMNVTQGGGTINNIICTNGIQGGGSDPEVYLALLPPTDTTIGGVYTVQGSGVSIDSNGLIRSVASADISAGAGIIVTDLGEEAYRVSAAPSTSGTIGSVKVGNASTSGLLLQADGTLSLSPPAGGIGGVKAGTGCTIAADGTLNATGTGGTITGVGAGTGLGGGGTTGAVSLFLKPATSNTIGGVYPGENVTIDPDGRINVSDAALGVLTVTGNAPINITGTVTNPTVNVDAATTSAPGVVTLTSAIDSTSETDAANALAVKTVADIANAALPLAGGTMTGAITFTGGQTFPGTVSSASFTQLGGILVGDTSPPGYAQLPLGSDGQYLTVNSASPLGVEWTTAPSNPTLQLVTDNGATTDNAVTFNNTVTLTNSGLDATTVMDGRSFNLTTVSPLGPTYNVTIDSGHPRISLNDILYIEMQTAKGGILLSDPTKTLEIVSDTIEIAGTNSSVFATLTAASFNIATPLVASGLAYPTADGPAGAALVTNGSGTLSFSTGFLNKSGGTMTGDITFAGTQTFPGVLAQGALSATGALEVGGTPANPILSVDTATTAQLGVVQPDGTTITVDGSGVISAVAPSASQPDYGNWYSDNTQTAQTLITGQPVTLNQTVATNNFSLLNGSQVTAAAAGVYNLQFSIQIVSSSGAGNVEIWLVKNGTAVANTNTAFSVKNANEAEFAALNYIETLASGDYLQLYWATDNLNCELAANLSTMGGPDIPSVIVTIVPVGA